MEESILDNEIIKSKKYSVGSVYLLRMNENMVAIAAFNKEKEIICSRSFFHNEKSKKQILKEANQYFKQVQECLYQKKIEMLDELDLF